MENVDDGKVYYKKMIWHFISFNIFIRFFILFFILDKFDFVIFVDYHILIELNTFENQNDRRGNDNKCNHAS